jgi:hypothetical protein
LPGGDGRQEWCKHSVEAVRQHLTDRGALQRAAREELGHGGGHRPREKPPIQPEGGPRTIPIVSCILIQYIYWPLPHREW